MKNYLLIKSLLVVVKEYIFIFLTATIFLFTSLINSFAEENVFTINNVKVKGTIDLNFSRDKYLNKAFLNSFQTLMNKILLTRDFEKVRGIKLKEIKNLVKSFQILKESYSKDEYNAIIKMHYSEIKVKKFLGNKNISFSQPENITSVFFPVLFVNDEVKNFNENFFYENWNIVEIENELINYILPLEDLDDISKIIEMKNKIEELEVDTLVNKYNVKNYVFALMDYNNYKLKVYLKTNFNNNKISKNISYEVKNLNDQILLNNILKDLKLKITDLWKEENLINVLMPLSINLKFYHKNIKNLDKLKSVFDKISIIDNYTLQEFDTNNSFFKIYYFGNPRKLRSELLKYGYKLNNDQGFWQLYLNE